MLKKKEQNHEQLMYQQADEASDQFSQIEYLEFELSKMPGENID